MPSEGPRSPGSAANDSILGIVAWATPSNALIEDGTTTTAALTTINLDSQVLRLANFGFTIPALAVIDGIQVEWKKKGSNISGGVQDEKVRLILNGNIGSVDRSQAPVWPASLAFVTHGGPSDLWGAQVTPTDLNSSNFGIAITASVIGSIETAEIDFGRITVFYHLGQSKGQAQVRSMMGLGV